MSFIEELYYGNINPNEKCMNWTSEYERAVKCVGDSKQKLYKRLKGDELRLFNEFSRASYEISEENSIFRKK